jgi:hypothetical protein
MKTAPATPALSRASARVRLSQRRRKRAEVPRRNAHTHRVAISNHRLLAFDGERVTFSYTDYARGNTRRTMTLTAMDFYAASSSTSCRAFLRIRQTGFLANTCRTARVTLARTALGASASAPASDATASTPAETTTRAMWACPRCGTGMIAGRILSTLQLATVTCPSTRHERAPPSASSCPAACHSNVSAGVCADTRSRAVHRQSPAQESLHGRQPMSARLRRLRHSVGATPDDPDSTSIAAAAPAASFKSRYRR